MKRILTLLIAVFLCSAFSISRAETYRINVGQFDRLSVVDNVEVVYHCHPDSTGYAVFKGGDEIADDFIFTNNKGALRIQLDTEKVDSDDIPVVHVYSDYLIAVSNSSLRPVTIESNASVPSFSVKLIGNGSIVAEGIKASNVDADFVTGNGSIVLSGTCGVANYRMVGTGTIQADLMKAEAVKCKIMGSGSIGCWPLKSLDVRGIGSTKIYYKGTPKVKKIGGGKLIPLTSEDGEELTSVTAHD